MLLLDVQVDIDPAKEETLNEWYYAHVPRLLSVPGYQSGRRYMALTPGPRYLALYEIKNQSYLPSLLGRDASLRDVKTLSEWARWDSDLVPHMSHCKTNVYCPRQEASAPLISFDTAIVTIRMEKPQSIREHSEEYLERHRRVHCGRGRGSRLSIAGGCSRLRNRLARDIAGFAHSHRVRWPASGPKYRARRGRSQGAHGVALYRRDRPPSYCLSYHSAPLAHYERLNRCRINAFWLSDPSPPTIGCLKNIIDGTSRTFGTFFRSPAFVS